MSCTKSSIFIGLHGETVSCQDDRRCCDMDKTKQSVRLVFRVPFEKYVRLRRRLLQNGSWEFLKIFFLAFFRTNDNHFSAKRFSRCDDIFTRHVMLTSFPAWNLCSGYRRQVFGLNAISMEAPWTISFRLGKFWRVCWIGKMSFLFRQKVNIFPEFYLIKVLVSAKHHLSA